MNEKTSILTTEIIISIVIVLMAIVIYFIAKNTSNDCKPQLEEVQEMKWLDIDNAINTITYENSKDLLKKVKKDLNL